MSLRCFSLAYWIHWIHWIHCKGSWDYRMAAGVLIPPKYYYYFELKEISIIMIPLLVSSGVRKIAECFGENRRDVVTSMWQLPSINGFSQRETVEFPSLASRRFHPTNFTRYPQMYEPTFLTIRPLPLSPASAPPFLNEDHFVWWIPRHLTYLHYIMIKHLFLPTKFSKRVLNLGGSEHEEASWTGERWKWDRYSCTDLMWAFSTRAIIYIHLYLTSIRVILCLPPFSTRLTIWRTSRKTWWTFTHPLTQLLAGDDWGTDGKDGWGRHGA